MLVPVLREAWRVPLSCGRPFQSKASDLLAILADLGRRYGTQHEDVLVVATEYAKELTASEMAEVVCHGDPHAGNVLRRSEGWALIDPDGFVGERAYDLGVVMRDACREVVDAEAFQPGASRHMLREECRRLAEPADVDSRACVAMGFRRARHHRSLPPLVRPRPRVSDLPGHGHPPRELGERDARRGVDRPSHEDP